MDGDDLLLCSDFDDMLLDTDDSFEFRRHFDVGNETITYNVQATFEGTGAQHATLNSTTFDGEDYTVCTVTYFQYKPSANMTTVTIEPHATDVMVPIKSPEELEQDAKATGFYRVEPEFSWWFPWFRLHFIGEYDGSRLLDIGNALVPLADSAFIDPSFAEQIDLRINDLPGLLLTGMIIGEILVWQAGNAGPFVFGAAVLTWIIWKMLLLELAYNSMEQLWVSLIANLISLAIGVINVLEQISLSAIRVAIAGAASIKNWAFAFVYKCAMIPVSFYLVLRSYERLKELGAI
jgi:hypothetical protein